MAGRLLGTIMTRLTAPPVALKVHAALVVTASFVVADSERGGWWAGPTIVAIVLWPLLRGSRLIWWVQVVAVLSGTVQALTVRARILTASDGLGIFVDERTLLLLASMLAVAWGLLLLPSVRRYCRDEPRTPLRAIAFVVGVLTIAAFPTMALGIESWLPAAEGLVNGGVFVGGDRERRVAFYVEEGSREVCLAIVWIDGGTHSCERRQRLVKHPFPFSAHGILADVAPDQVEGVDVVFRSGTRRAKIIDSSRVRADVYYLLDAAPARELLRVVGYDASGAEVFRSRLDY